MMLYRVRWQVELLFKELKSHNNLKKYLTQQKAIVEGLIWASLLTLILKRMIATKAMQKVSFFKAAKNSDIWFIPIMQSIALEEYTKLKEMLEWAFIYLQKNAQLAQQKKSKGDSSLQNIYSHFNS